MGCDVLIIDAVEFAVSHVSHLTFSGAINEIKKIKPKKAYMIGMVRNFCEKSVVLVTK